ncbi:hypothetical protein BIV57_10430 [Mangrovactinospora gilvigrisea]|uniref:Resolvase/invertase-type recombinase catalytic domain-containing protein n=1 Tax=Mangrovactinospora gilvigrisea TaxID=1428644 RepID=A0A1J7BG31_9ACTN|nr:recombinase family protein [Mangrovactinospora gilvigrisea]OIV37533.1 hypothetical protein BIV57_10430 [Mangrovactinospora gilvigrisea]
MTKSAIHVEDGRASEGALRAVNYLRVSKREQAAGYGIAYTGKKTAEYIRGKGWDLVATFKDAGESGMLPWRERAGAAGLMRLAEQMPSPFDVVVVFESRAIGRTSRAFWSWVWRLQDLGVHLAIVDEDVDNTSDEGEARMREMADEAFKELARIRKRSQDGLQEKAESGGFPGGAPRYGYRIENQGRRGEQRLVPDRCDGGSACSAVRPCMTVHEADVLRRAHQLVVTGQGNFRKAALELNAEGLLTRSGSPWTHANLRSRLLNDDFLGGRYVFRAAGNAELGRDGAPAWGESVALALEPVLSQQEVRELLVLKGRKARRSTTRPGGVYSLPRRITSPCGKHYVGATSSAWGRRTYQCAGKSEAYPGAPVCSCSQLAADGVEGWAWNAARTLVEDPDRLASLTADWISRGQQASPDYSRRLADIDRRIAEQFDAIDVAVAVAATRATRRGLTGESARGAVEKALRPLERELRSLQHHRTEIEGWCADAALADRSPGDIRALLVTDPADVDPESKREVFALLDLRIQVKGNRRHRGGRDCPVAAWFRERGRVVPNLTDGAWARAAVAVPVADGGTVPRQSGAIAPRDVLAALLDKARTGCSWNTAGARSGTRGLRAHWLRWTVSGRWEAAMEAMQHSDGVPAYDPRPLPPMEMTWRLSGGILSVVP